jgi:hypothetical protein
MAASHNGDWHRRCLSLCGTHADPERHKGFSHLRVTDPASLYPT